MVEAKVNELNIGELYFYYKGFAEVIRTYDLGHDSGYVTHYCSFNRKLKKARSIVYISCHEGKYDSRISEPIAVPKILSIIFKKSYLEC